MLSGVNRLLCLRWTVKPLCVVLLFVWESAAGHDFSEPVVAPHERAKDLSPIYGRYEIYEAVKYGASVGTTPAEAQAQVGQELIVTAALYHARGTRIEQPIYKVWFYPDSPGEGIVVDRSEWWSSMYGLSEGQPGGDEIIEVHDSIGLWTYLEVIGTNELWNAFDGYYYKTRKTTRPVVAVGHEDYCRDFGPCSAGQGGCDSDAECQSGLACAQDVGATYGFAATLDVCAAADQGNLRGSVAPTRTTTGGRE